MDVETVIAGVDVAVATLPAKPLAETTETLVTVPAPAGAAQEPSPLQKVDALADVPLFKFVTGKFPVMPVVKGNPVKFVATPAEGVPRSGVTNVGELANTKAPDPVSSVTAEAKLAELGVPKKVATPVPKDVIPVPPLATPKVPVMSAVERVTASHVAFVPSV